MPELGATSRLEAPQIARFDLSSPGIVTLKTGKVELGQGILLALRQIAAEELDLTVDAVGRQRSGAWRQKSVSTGRSGAPLCQSPRSSTRRLGRTYHRRTCLSASAAVLSFTTYRVSDSGVEIWSHSQNVFALRDQIGRVLGRPAQDVIVRHRLGAGCYGHNGADDAAMDAAMLARAVPGRPVRVQWTRKDELRCEPLGSPMRISISACVREGCIAQWM